MNPVLQVLENRGLVSSDSVERLFNDWKFSEVRGVQEELDAALDQDTGLGPLFQNRPQASPHLNFDNIPLKS